MLSFKIVLGFVHQSTMKTIFISIFLLAAISITPNDAHDYDKWVARLNDNVSKTVNSMKELSRKYDVSQDVVSQKINDMYFVKNNNLKHLEECLKSWKPDYGRWVVLLKPLNEDELHDCLRRVEGPIPRIAAMKLREAEILCIYYGFVNNMNIHTLRLEDFVENLRRRYNLDKDDIAPEKNELFELNKNGLESLKGCLKLKDYEDNPSRADLSSLEIDEVRQCLREAISSFSKSVEIAERGAELLFKYYGWVKKLNAQLSESNDFIRKLGNKYNLNEDDITPKINELSFLERHFLESLDECLTSTKFGSSAIARSFESLDPNELDQCLKKVEDPFKNAVDIVEKGAEPLFIHQRSVSNVHTFILESENFIRNLTNKYTLTEDDMAPKMKELSFLKKQVLGNLGRCLKFWFIRQPEGGFHNKHELGECLERVKEPFDYAVNVVRNEAELSFKTDCTFLYEVRWMNNFVASCTDPLIRDAMNRRAVDCVYFELSNSVINSIEKQVVDTTVLHTKNICHTVKFSELLPRFVHWKTMLWSKLRSDSINILNNIASKNNKCLTENIEKELMNLHSWNEEIVKELYDYIQIQKQEYEEC